LAQQRFDALVCAGGPALTADDAAETLAGGPPASAIDAAATTIASRLRRA